MKLKRIILLLPIVFLGACINSVVKMEGTYLSNVNESPEIMIEKEEITIIKEEYDEVLTITADLVNENREDSENQFYSLNQKTLNLEYSFPETATQETYKEDDFIKAIEHRALVNNYNQDYIDMHMDYFNLFMFIDDEGKVKISYPYEELLNFMEDYSYLTAYNEETRYFLNDLETPLEILTAYSQELTIEAIVKENEVRALVFQANAESSYFEENRTFFRK